MKTKHSVNELILQLQTNLSNLKIFPLRLSTLRTLYRQDTSSRSFMISRSYIRIASTILLILFSLLPYLDVFLQLFWDIDKIPMNRFANLSTAIWTYSICISPLLILFASKLNPYRFAYYVTIYVYLTMFCGLFFLDINVNISSIWLFRLITLILTVFLVFIGNIVVNYCKMVKIKEEVLNELLKNRN